MPSERETHVKSKTKRQSLPRLYNIYRPTPTEIAAVQKVALAYREGWRKEVAASVAAAEHGGEADVRSAFRRRNKDEAARRTAFASAIARAELGRHYWDERKLGQRKRPAPRRRTNGKAPK